MSLISAMRAKAQKRPSSQNLDIFAARAFVEYYDTNRQCFYCNTEYVNIVNHAHSKTIDHIIPRSIRGKNRPENYVCACKNCNGTRGSMDFIEYGIKSIVRNNFMPGKSVWELPKPDRRYKCRYFTFILESMFLIGMLLKQMGHSYAEQQSREGFAYTEI